MTVREGTSAIAIALAMASFAGYGWLREHDARLKAESQTGQQQKQIDSLQEQQSDVRQALSAKLALLEQQRSRPVTAMQLVTDSAALMPDLPEPLQVRAAPFNPALPDAPPTHEVVVPEADFKSIRSAQIGCEEASAKLEACGASEQDERSQLKLTEQQRDEWKTAAKGGSVWHRALGAAKWFAVGAGTGAVAYAVARHK